MIEDFHACEDGVNITADVCIVGAGAAGITLAREFLGTPFRVVLLESGGLDKEDAIQGLNAGEAAGLPHGGMEKGRVRGFGGTTIAWGGQTFRLDAFDLQPRSWVPNSGWPISLQELEPYYERAEQVLQLGPNLSYAEMCARNGIAPPAFDAGKLFMHFSRWSPIPNFGTAYRKQLKEAENISVLVHATVTQIVTNPAANTVEQVEITTLAGKTGTVKARLFIICCGGIDTARLLLASDRVEKQGVGNRHDVVGRYFQDHMHIWYDYVVATNRKQLQNFGESFFIGGRKYAPLVVLGEGIQAEKQLLRMHGTIIFWMEADSSVSAIKTLFRAMRGRTLPAGGELRKLVRDSVSDPGELVNVMYRYWIQKRAGTPKRGPVYLAALGEMAPNPESRVTLGETRDALGMRRARMDWRLGELERRTALEYARTVASELARLGLGSYDLKQAALLENKKDWVKMATDSYHHMGTTRMHENEKLGVVDRNCKVHGIDNLYVGSSAVFPSSGSTSPTSTILALCIRIADRLKQQLVAAKPLEMQSIGS